MSLESEIWNCYMDGCQHTLEELSGIDLSHYLELEKYGET